MNRIFKWFLFLKNVALHEAAFILKSTTFILLLIIIPALLFPFFAFVYNEGLLSDIPVAVYDADNSELSRTLTRAIESSRSMKITGKLSSLSELEKNVRNGTFKAAFYFPQDMERNIKKQHQGYPVFYKNSQNIVIANFLYKETIQIFKTYNAGIVLKKIRMAGFSESQAKSVVQPIIADISYLYNPNFNYDNFLSPAYIFVLCQMIMMLSGMFCIVHEIQNRKFVRLIEGAQSLTGALIIGKVVPVLVLFGTVLSIVQFVLFPLFRIYISGPPLVVFILIIIFLMASLLPGFALGAILKNPLIATEVIIFINMPTLLLSGYTFPAVPKILVVIAQILPFTHFMVIFFKIGQMNCPLIDATREITKLIYFILIGFFVTWLSLIRLNKSIEKVGRK